MSSELVVTVVAVISTTVTIVTLIKTLALYYLVERPVVSLVMLFRYLDDSPLPVSLILVQTGVMCVLMRVIQ